jgi:hypothetical protein
VCRLNIVRGIAYQNDVRDVEGCLILCCSAVLGADHQSCTAPTVLSVAAYVKVDVAQEVKRCKFAFSDSPKVASQDRLEYVWRVGE